MKNKQDMLNEVDLLNGNINRICVTNDINELTDMYYHAITRIAFITHFNIKRIHDNEANNENK